MAGGQSPLEPAKATGRPLGGFSASRCIRFGYQSVPRPPGVMSRMFLNGIGSGARCGAEQVGETDLLTVLVQKSVVARLTAER